MKKTLKIPVIFDCDNTFGIPNCDVDDGLALLYLLGCPEVELLGITCTYGNNTQDTVYENTQRLLRTWGRGDIPVLRGAASPKNRQSAAAVFLAQKARKYHGELRVLATGAMTNLLGAQEIDASFLKNVHTFSLMGGLTEPLFVGGRPMNELNLSCDNAASLAVMRNGKRVMIATAQNCLKSFFPKKECIEMLRTSEAAIARYLEKHLMYWFDLNEQHWNISGIVNWDVMAAAQLVHPEYFEMATEILSPTLTSLQKGWLTGAGTPISVTLPRIIHQNAYVHHIYSTYLSAHVVL
ncbi:MAG: nucleoside hydrolase [Oscillospiraceae bacterium]|nr:nucleoside hydrolase [Oscillospiraceae bacterium]